MIDRERLLARGAGTLADLELLAFGLANEQLRTVIAGAAGARGDGWARWPSQTIESLFLGLGSLTPAVNPPYWYWPQMRPSPRRPQPSTPALAGELPRQRFAAAGAEALSDAELLALLLKGGRANQETVERVRFVLHDLGGLAGLPSTSTPALRKLGLRESQGMTVGALVELARRLAFAEVPERDPLGRPAEVVRYLHLRYGNLDQEVLGALFLNTRWRLLSCRDFFRGTLTRAAVEPRAILKEALLLGASSLVLFHTHPSGDPTPSEEDRRFTRHLALAAEVMGIKLEDHLIVAGAGRWVSLRERGRI